MLHDVFGFAHGETAASIGKAGTAVRQITHRARRHVQARRRRFQPDSAAARRPITGRAEVARFVLGVLRTTTATSG
ncbi:hypothetical protein San01_01280 [Streptomyces angustmyceticus]|uniref:RNA polymerase sigma factor 70 region 4 type 2 domain-containing protein n=1 Tax=Streptomyces angustmyceticus TaxID=285578 RepID=A0A5J4L612_9ACTN|nr:hypothetical protein San01_01280 [Streptomyces angustmyceticus]